jgi:hypothetical protein
VTAADAKAFSYDSQSELVAMDGGAVKMVYDGRSGTPGPTDGRRKPRRPNVACPAAARRQRPVPQTIEDPTMGAAPRKPSRESIEFIRKMRLFSETV